MKDRGNQSKANPHWEMKSKIERAVARHAGWGETRHDLRFLQ